MSAHSWTKVAQSPTLISGRHSMPIVRLLPGVDPACQAKLKSPEGWEARAASTTSCAKVPAQVVPQGLPRSHATTFANGTAEGVGADSEVQAARATALWRTSTYSKGSVTQPTLPVLQVIGPLNPVRNLALVPQRTMPEVCCDSVAKRPAQSRLAALCAAFGVISIFTIC